VPIPSELWQFFSAAAIRPFDYVFTTAARGCSLSHQSMWKMWRSFKKYMQVAAGCKVVIKGGAKEYPLEPRAISLEEYDPRLHYTLVPPLPVADDLTPYCLRHTFCTDMQDAGVPVNVAKDLMGHSNISITADIYTHMTEFSLQSTAEMMDAYRGNFEGGLLPCAKGEDQTRAAS
jgi:integrase